MQSCNSKCHKLTRFKSTSILLGYLLSTIFLAGCSKEPQQDDQPPLRLVRTQVVSSNSAQDWREFPGVVEAAQTADLGFRVPGKLEKIMVLEGDHVKKGQLLAILDDTDYQIQLSGRQADFDKAEADFKRGKSLLSQQLIASADFDKLKAQHAASLAALTSAKQNVEYTQLKAPFDGSIASRHVDNFEDVSAVQPIFTLQDMSSIHVKVNIPETLMIRLKQESKATVFAIFDAIPGQQFPLSVQEIATQADPGSKTFAVTFNMPTVDTLNILPGMSVTVRGKPPAQPQEGKTPMMVPSQAVIENNAGRFAFVVENLQNNIGTVKQRAVETGRVSAQGLEVFSGLKPGDLLITAGMSKMSEGLQVRVNQEWSK